MKAGNNFVNESSWFFFLLTVAEGYVILSAELSVAQFIGIYYGTTLICWSSVIISVMTGLAAGYFSSAYCINFFKELHNLLFWILGISFIWLWLIPRVGFQLMNFLYNNAGFEAGVALSSMSLIFPLAFLLSMIPPVVSGLWTVEINKSGRITGLVFAISTLAGLAGIFISGFLIIPVFGLTKVFEICGGTTLMLWVLVCFKARKTILSIVWIGIYLIAFMITRPSKPIRSLAHLVDQKEGILGQVSVLETIHKNEKKIKKSLFINNIPQSMVQKGFDSLSLLQYVHRIAVISSVLPKNSEALLFGYGAGNIANEFVRMGFRTDAVELDKHVIEMAKKYFYFNKDKINIFYDDARHYIRTCQKKYDLVVMDISTGEIQSSNNFTLENFRDIFSRILNPEGIFIVNFQGYMEGKKGEGARAIYNTLVKAGFDTRYWKLEKEKLNDILLVGLKSIKYPGIDTARLNFCCKGKNFENTVFSNRPVDITVPILLTDDVPILEKMVLPVSMEARELNINLFVKNKLQVGMPLVR